MLELVGGSVDAGDGSGSSGPGDCDGGWGFVVVVVSGTVVVGTEPTPRVVVGGTVVVTGEPTPRVVVGGTVVVGTEPTPRVVVGGTVVVTGEPTPRVVVGTTGGRVVVVVVVVVVGAVSFSPLSHEPSLSSASSQFDVPSQSLSRFTLLTIEKRSLFGALPALMVFVWSFLL